MSMEAYYALTGLNFAVYINGLEESMRSGA